MALAADDSEASPVLNVINLLQRLKKFAEKDHPEKDFTRLAHENFQINSIFGCHYFIVSKPQGRTLQETFPNAMVPKILVKSLIAHLFYSVNWLLTTCGVTHTGNLPQNMLVHIEDDTILKYVEGQET
ncbi:hypothetical protein ACJ72_00437 [Emergomyces africanus]|uniref:Protein kinase domain-containing protein n=1 Tax=Emergomyces africanus TaxID=1955775 RepID=A0A1B7P810_9EURO|nr:hypothetical protein ACJ72_00437 [Emergomyces africanus]